MIDEDYRRYDLEQWIEYSKDNLEDPRYLGTVTAPRFEILIPQVIYLTQYENLPSKRIHIRFSRKNIFHRDGFTCQYCGEKGTKDSLTLDHVLPKSRGGKSSYLNLVAACLPCNNWKADRTPQEAEMPLLKQPKEPSWRSNVGISFNQIKHPYWDRFLF